jgi:hypothetical protein
MTIQNRLIHFFDFGDGSGVSIWQHGFDIIQKGWFQYAALRYYSSSIDPQIQQADPL